MRSTNVRSLTRNLRDTLADFRKRRGFGRGIAAPQIGSSLRVLYIDHRYSGALINPRIVQRSRKTFALWDDCFSFPDMLVWLKRYETIRVDFLNEAGERTSISASGSLAELLQHEIDHLDGILAVDRAAQRKDIILRSERRKTRH